MYIEFGRFRFGGFSVCVLKVRGSGRGFWLGVHGEGVTQCCRAMETDPSFHGAAGGGGVRLKPGLFGSWHSGFLLPN